LFNIHFNDYCYYYPRNDRFEFCRQHRFIIHSPEDKKIESDDQEAGRDRHKAEGDSVKK
jgi:hypothetical protein